MRLYFKKGREKLHFLWCTSLRIEEKGTFSILALKPKKILPGAPRETYKFKKSKQNQRPMNVAKGLIVLPPI